MEAEVESASRATLEELAWPRIERFLREQVIGNAFHERRAIATGINLESVTSLDKFRMIPLMRKEEVIADQSAHPPFGTIANCGMEEIVDITETSGTTGKGCEVYPLSRSDFDAAIRMEMFGFYWAGIEPGRIAVATFPLTTRAAGRWHQAAVNRLGGIYMPLGTYDTARKLDYLARFPVYLLTATPSYLQRLEMEAEAIKVDLRSLGITSLLTAGETFTVEWALERQDRWGATLYEQYGSTQRALAWSCEAGATPHGRRGVLHILPHLEFIEVIDPESGDPTEVGEFGELVVTPFSASAAAPLMRFASGDRVRWLGYGACSCGRLLPAIEGGTVQRFDDMLKVKGVNLYPETVDAVVLRMPIVDYEGILSLDQNGREHVTVRVEFAANTSASVRQQRLRELHGELAEVLHLRIECEEHIGPPLAPDMRQDMKKRRRWKDSRR